MIISHDFEWAEYQYMYHDSVKNIAVVLTTGIELYRLDNISVFVSVSKQVSKCRFVERDYVTPFNALTLRMSSEHVSPKLFRVNSWILQMIRQWIPDSWSGDRKCTGPKRAVANSRNWQLITSGRLQVLATSNFRDWHTVVGEIPWSSVLKTK